MKPTLVKCDCCNATGKMPLPQVLQETLDVIPRDRFISTQEIVQRVGDKFVAATAINNRLRIFLRDKFGLIASERHGKALHWKRVK